MSFAASALAGRFALVIEGLCHAVARRGGRGGGIPGPLLILIWSRLRRMAARFTRLAAQGQAGFGPAPSRMAAPRPRPAPKPLTRAPVQPPRSFAALLRLVPETAQLTGQLRHLLADPEMTALLATTPELGRILRPLCHMLGIRLTPATSPAAQPPLLGRSGPVQARPAQAPPAIPPPATPALVFPFGVSLNAA